MKKRIMRRNEIQVVFYSLNTCKKLICMYLKYMLLSFENKEWGKKRI